jgi:F0F1-type ATP synthase membrane subunit c/vacuolar-type H+-ATPase subunit K
MMSAFLGLVAMTALMLGWRFLLLPTTGVHARVPRHGGVAVLRPPRGRNLMFAGLALAPTLILLALLLQARQLTRADQAGLALALALLACGGAAAVSLLAAEFRQELRVDPDQLESVFVLTTKRVRWKEVQRIRWNPASRWFFLAAAGAWLWVPIDFDGIGDFAELALAALPPAVLGASLETRRELEELAATARTA